MQKIHFSCTACGQRYTVGAHVAGKKVKCRHCQTILCVPAVESDSAKVAERQTVSTEDGEPGIASHRAKPPSVYKISEETASTPKKNRPDTVLSPHLLPEQPADSKAVLETHADGLTITVPPAGVWRGSAGLFSFSLMCLAFALVAGGGLLASGRMKGVGWKELVEVYGILLFHLVIGVSLLLGAINMGKRQAVFAMVGETLIVLQTGIFGSKRQKWKRAQIAGIRTGPSGMESETSTGVAWNDWSISRVNRTPVIELQILLHSGKKFGMLAGREEPELEWMATVLHCALDVLHPNAVRERSEQPADSKAVLETHADGLTITVPPAGVWRGSKGLFSSSLLVLAFTLVLGGVVAAAIGGRMEEVGWRELVLLLFPAVGIGMLLGAINMGTRRAVFAVVGETLMARQTGIFGSKRRKWKREQIADIRTGRSRMDSNRTRVIELQIVRHSGKKFRMLAGREVPELQWLATVLRSALRVPHTSSS
jgi:hypothetical protein